MTTDELKIEIKAVDNATKVIKDVKKSQDDLTKSTDNNAKASDRASKSEKARVGGLKNLKAGLAGVAVAAAALFKGVQVVNKEWAEQNKLNKNLERSLMNVGVSFENAGRQVDFFNSRLDRMSRITRFDDEILSAGLDKLVGVTGNATLAMRDLELAMDMSTKTGKDLNGMVDALTKAYAGEFQELVPLGLISKTQANEFQNMTNKGFATHEVLELLRGSTSGLSQNLTESEKAARGLNADWDALMEAMGKGVENVLAPLNAQLGKLVGSSDGGDGFFGILAKKIDKATSSLGKFIETFDDDFVANALKVAGVMGVLGATGGTAAIPMAIGFVGSQDVDGGGSSSLPRGYVPGGSIISMPDVEATPDRAKKPSSKSSGKGRTNDDPFGIKALDSYIAKQEELQNMLDETTAAMMEKDIERARINRENREFERTHELEKQKRQEQIQDSERRHQEYVKRKQEEYIAKQKQQLAEIASGLQQGAGLASRGADMMGAPSGVGGILSGGAGLVGGYLTMNPMAMIGGGMDLIGGISDLFSSGPSKESQQMLKEEREKRKHEMEKMKLEEKRQRVEFQKSLQAAIVDALRESRDNLAVTYIINQSGNYLGNDNASLRQVQAALAGTGRLERNR